MSNWLKSIVGTSLKMGLSKTSIALVLSNRQRKTQTVLADCLFEKEISLDSDQLDSAFNKGLAKQDYAGLPLISIVSDEWARLFVVTPPTNANSLRDLQAAVNMRFQTLYDESPHDWQIQADWNNRKPFLACALPRNLITRLQLLAQQHSLYLLSVVPQFIAAWNSCCPRLTAGDWFGVVHEERVTIAAVDQRTQNLDTIWSLPIANEKESTSAWMQEQIKRISTRLTIPMPGQLLLYGNWNRYWLTNDDRIDELRIKNIDKKTGGLLNFHVASDAEHLACSGN